MVAKLYFIWKSEFQMKIVSCSCWIEMHFGGKCYVFPVLSQISTHTISHLICALISENEGLEKSRSASNLRKISVPAQLNFFSVCHLSFFFKIYTIDLKKIQVTNWKKNQVCRNWNFSKVWSRPWFLKTFIFRNQGAD